MLTQICLSEIPSVNMMGQIRQPVGWKNRNRHPTASNMLILVREGDMHFQMAGEQYDLEKGDFLLIQRGASYAVNSQESCLYTFVHFMLAEPVLLLPEERVNKMNSEELKRFQERRAHSPYSMPCPDHQYIYLPISGKIEGEQEKIWLMLTECDMYRYEMTPNRKLRINLLFAEMLSLLDVQAHSNIDHTAYPTALTRILPYIHEHYTEPITLSTLSDVFGLSKQYIMRLFQKHLHITVTHYISQLKLEHSLELLRYSTFRVNEVSEILGFGNSYYFCRMFRKQFGMTPTEYIHQSMNAEQGKPSPRRERVENKSEQDDQ